MSGVDFLSSLREPFNDYAVGEEALCYAAHYELPKKLLGFAHGRCWLNAKRMSRD